MFSSPCWGFYIVVIFTGWRLAQLCFELLTGRGNKQVSNGPINVTYVHQKTKKVIHGWELKGFVLICVGLSVNFRGTYLGTSMLLLATHGTGGDARVSLACTVQEIGPFNNVFQYVFPNASRQALGTCV
ncbi:hypothetical protein F4808DRAFT_422613 [Astrocystis sublimbata]|nr:hypothetical protein F4808DRAFT_422613 [Astrocystis sublimbata]